jgi:hypothetical protein
MADRCNARTHHVMHRVDASSTATVIMKCIFQQDMQISYAFCISSSRRGKKKPNLSPHLTRHTQDDWFPACVHLRSPHTLTEWRTVFGFLYTRGQRLHLQLQDRLEIAHLTACTDTHKNPVSSGPSTHESCHAHLAIQSGAQWSHMRFVRSIRCEVTLPSVCLNAYLGWIRLPFVSPHNIVATRNRTTLSPILPVCVGVGLIGCKRCYCFLLSWLSGIWRWRKQNMHFYKFIFYFLWCEWWYCFLLCY